MSCHVGMRAMMRALRPDQAEKGWISCCLSMKNCTERKKWREPVGIREKLQAACVADAKAWVWAFSGHTWEGQEPLTPNSTHQQLTGSSFLWESGAPCAFLFLQIEPLLLCSGSFNVCSLPPKEYRGLACQIRLRVPFWGLCQVRASLSLGLVIQLEWPVRELACQEECMTPGEPTIPEWRAVPSC